MRLQFSYMRVVQAVKIRARFQHCSYGEALKITKENIERARRVAVLSAIVVVLVMHPLVQLERGVSREMSSSVVMPK